MCAFSDQRPFYICPHWPDGILVPVFSDLTHTHNIFSRVNFLETLIFLALWRRTRRILESILKWSKRRVWKIRIWCKRGSCTHVWSEEGGEEANVYYLQIDPTICAYDGSKILVQSSCVPTYWFVASTSIFREYNSTLSKYLFVGSVI